MDLKQLIASEPGNASKSDAQVLSWLKDSITVWADVEWREFLIWLHQSGITRSTLSTTAAGTGATATAAQHFIDVINAGNPLGASDSRVRQLVQDSSLSVPLKNSLAALAQRSVPRWSQITTGVTGPMDDASWLYHIALARA